MRRLLNADARLPFLQTAAAVVAMASGAGYLFGPASLRRSTSLQIASQVMPLTAWGAMFLAVGLGCFIAHLLREGRYLAHCGAAAVYCGWSTTMFVAWVSGVSTAAGGPWLTALAACVHVTCAANYYVPYGRRHRETGG